MRIKWKHIPGKERPIAPWIKDGSLFGIPCCICDKHRKIWREGADFPEACEECVRKIYE